MPRSLILGSGGLTILWDESGRISELYYPGPGQANHLQDGGIRFGIWRENQLQWLDSEGWSRSFNFDPETQEGMIRYEGLCTIECRSRVERDCLQMAWTSSTDCRLFINARLNIGESDIGNTALWLEEQDAIVHHKDGFGFSISSQPSILGIACGIAGFGDSEGTWRDAEDGELSGNPIAQGSVDSTCAIEMSVSSPVVIAIRAHKMPFAPIPLSIPKPLGLTSGVKAKASQVFGELPAEISRLCRISEAIVRSHVFDGRVPVAALDRSVMSTNRAHYAHCWMRDAAQIVDILLDLGDPEPAQNFLKFCASVLNPNVPAYLQKYTVEGHLASSWHPWRKGQPPIQLDETAWVVKLGAKMLTLGLIDFELAKETVLPSAIWMTEYVDATGLPLPSWDVWEERLGVASNTVAVVISALSESASAWAKINSSLSSRLDEAANRMQKAFLSQLIHPMNGTIVRSISDVTTCDASIMNVFNLGIIEPSNEITANTLDWITETLHVRDGICGIARYEDDYYYRRHDDLPGNPWVICTLWLAQNQLARARTVADLEEPMNWMNWVNRRANSAGVLAEQYDARTGEPLVVAPLAWSHAELLKTGLQYQRVYAKLTGTAS